MGMFLPEDIAYRITRFMGGKSAFPFIEKHETMGIFYLFGKNFGVKGPIEILSATDLAKRAIDQMVKEIEICDNTSAKFDSDFIRDSYNRRALQISVEFRNDNSSDISEKNRRISGDPAILSNCFAQHIAYYKKDFFFEIFQPFKGSELPISLKKLEKRMLLLGFNVRDSKSLPEESAFSCFLKWLKRNG
jgi:hypothetical protein